MNKRFNELTMMYGNKHKNVTAQKPSQYFGVNTVDSVKILYEYVE